MGSGCATGVNGQLTRLIEALAINLGRETTGSYDPGLPAFVATMAEPSTSGFPNLKTATLGYEASGDRTSPTIDGCDDVLAFSLNTASGLNGGGSTRLPKAS